MKLVLASLLGLLVFTGCETTPEMSPQQRRALQVRTFDATYKNVFNAFKTVLQDEGYIISNQDFSGGMILAQATKSSNRGSVKFMRAFASRGSDYVTSEGYSISANFEEINKTTTESRLILQKTQNMKRGSSTGNELLDPAIYKNIYQKVSVEIKRRQASGR